MQVGQAKTVSGGKLRQVLSLAAEKTARMKLTTNVTAMPFFTCLLRVDERDMVIDALEPTLLEEELLIDAAVDLAFPLNSRGYFIGRAKFRGLTTGGPGRYVLSVPEQLLYVRHRRTQRVTPPASLPVTCLSIGGDRISDSVSVKDISLEGIGLLFMHEDWELEIGQVLRQIKLKIAGSKYLTLDAAVRHIFFDEDGRSNAGLMWEPMPKSQYLTLQNYIQLVQEHDKRADLAQSE